MSKNFKRILISALQDNEFVYHDWSEKSQGDQNVTPHVNLILSDPESNSSIYITNGAWPAKQGMRNYIRNELGRKCEMPSHILCLKHSFRKENKMDLIAKHYIKSLQWDVAWESKVLTYL